MNIQEAYQHKIDELTQLRDEYELALMALKAEWPEVLKLRAPSVMLGNPTFIVVEDTSEDLAVKVQQITGRAYPIGRLPSGGWDVHFKIRDGNIFTISGVRR